MNTIKTTVLTNAILAINLGQYKCVVGILDRASGEYRFSTFDTSQAKLRKSNSPGA